MVVYSWLRCEHDVRGKRRALVERKGGRSAPQGLRPFPPEGIWANVKSAAHSRPIGVEEGR